MADGEKTLDIILKYGLDASSLQQTTAGVNSTTSALANQEQQLRRNRMELREMSQVFSAIGLAGAAIYVPAVAASQLYLKSAGQNEALSRAWLADTDKIKQSTVDLGRVVTEGLLPGYDKLANLVAQFSVFADKNPQLVQAAVGLAGGLVAIGAAGKIFVEADRAVVDIQLIAATLMKKAADEQLAAGTAYGTTGGLIGPATAPASAGSMLVSAIAPLIIPIIAAVGGAAIYDAIKPKNAPTAAQIIPEANADIYASFVKPILDKLGPFGQSVEKFDESVLKFQLGVTGAKDYAATGGIGQSGGMSQADYNTGLSEFTAHEQTMANIQKTYDDAMTTENANYQQSIQNADTTFDAQRIKEQQAYDQASQQAQQDYQDSVAKETRDFNEQQAQALASFQQQQSDAIANFQDSELQAQQTYQNQMADLDQSHQDRLHDLTQSHDILGIENENRSYAEQKSKDQRDFSQADAQRREQLAKTLADNQRNYNEQNAQRLASFRQQQADELNNYNTSKAQRDDAFIQQQKDEADQHQTELDTIDQNHRDKIAQLKQNLADQDAVEQAAWMQQYDTLVGVVTTAEAATSALYNAFLKSMGVNTTNAESTSTTHDAGGYFMPGATRNATGKPEWVAAPDTVRYAEQIVGGRLTQQNLIAAMISGRNGGSSSPTNNNSQTVNMSGLTAQDRLIIQDMMNHSIQAWSTAQFGSG